MIHDRTKITIISGGQTGVDRGALAGAIIAGFEVSGWCPKDRLAEDGRIPDIFNLAETESSGYRQRMIKNVVDSDGTVIIYWSYPTSGVLETIKTCINKKKPMKLIDASTLSSSNAATLIKKFIDDFELHKLNFAGPSESKQLGAHDYTSSLIEKL